MAALSANLILIATCRQLSAALTGNWLRPALRLWDATSSSIIEHAGQTQHAVLRARADPSAVIRQVVAGLILREGRVLICQRTKYQPMPLKWEFPGGKIEQGEEPVSALERELEEELGIRAKIGPEVATIRHYYRSGTRSEEHTSEL